MAEETQLNRQETEALIDLIRKTRMKYLQIEKADLQRLAPDEELLEEVNEGNVNLQTRELHLKIADRKYFRIPWLEDDPGVSVTHEDYAYNYWYEMLNGLNMVLGFERMIELFAQNLDQSFDALSTGQAEALLKKIIPRARDNKKSLNSTTRSQLQQIRDKIKKYQPLVDYIGPFFSSTMKPFASGADPVAGGVGVQGPLGRSMTHVLQQQHKQLKNIPPHLEDKDQTEIEKVKEASKREGIYTETPVAEEKFYFACAFCDLQIDMDPSVAIIDQQQEHHGRPMLLRVSRTTGSDY